MNDYFLKFIETITQKKLNLHHIVIYQDDVLREKYSWVPHDRRVEIHSASKSVTALAAGIAMEEGLFTMDTRPMDVLATHLPEQYPANLEKVQVRHLITMSIGRDHFLMPGFSNDPNVITRDMIEDEDWIHYIFEQDIPYEPGTHFMYDTSAWYLISAMITELTGQTMVQWLRPRLFTPLGIRNPQWLMCPQGRNVGAGGLLLNCDEFSRLGRVCLNDGRWRDKQLIPEAFMADAKNGT